VGIWLALGARARIVRCGWVVFMPKIYSNREPIPGLSGKVRGGLTLVIESPAEISGLQTLIRSAAVLPGGAIANAYNAIKTAGSQIADWPSWHDQNLSSSTLPEFPAYDPASQLEAALGLAKMLWTSQSEDVDQIALAMALPVPGKRRLFLEARRPALVLDAGSVRARIVSAGAKVRQFGVALFPKAPTRRRGNLVEALRARSQGTPLPRLEGLNPADLNGKRGVIVFLHGLISSDVGTFDQLIVRIKNDNSLADVHLIGWPHDTLARIKVNAQDLAELIENRLGPSGLPLLFVCHSRGGLVARATAVKLIEGNSDWAKRLKGAVTFGTPHMGAELAERGDELLGKVLLLKTIRGAGKSVPLIDALLTVAGRKKVEGITDLRPTSNGGEFLYWLRETEAKQAGGSGKRVLPMFVVGGRVETGSTTGWLSRRFFGGEPNDLVVALSSTMPTSMQPSSQTATDHFSYLSTQEMQRPDIPALDYIVAAFNDHLEENIGRAPARSHVRVTHARTAKRAVSPATGANPNRRPQTRSLQSETTDISKAGKATLGKFVDVLSK
jgi:pimeloyl-ACP methyl ester carboxylesterase